MLALLLAYLLAAQGLVAAVGFGMSFASGQPGFVICSSPVADSQQRATGDHRQKPASMPECPFCFVASQSVGAAATVGGEPMLPAYTASPLAAVLGGLTDKTVIPEFRHTGGEARAPPQFSV
jgi:hypothetical protein